MRGWDDQMLWHLMITMHYVVESLMWEVITETDIAYIPINVRIYSAHLLVNVCWSEIKEYWLLASCKVDIIKLTSKRQMQG